MAHVNKDSFLHITPWGLGSAVMDCMASMNSNGMVVDMVLCRKLAVSLAAASAAERIFESSLS